MPGEMDEIVAEFLVESYESLDRLDRDLLALERDPHSRGVLASTFRTMHTIKGTCGFLGFAKLERIAHVEQVAVYRNADAEDLPPAVADRLAEGSVDWITVMLGARVPFNQPSASGLKWRFAMVGGGTGE